MHFIYVYVCNGVKCRLISDPLRLLPFLSGIESIFQELNCMAPEQRPWLQRSRKARVRRVSQLLKNNIDFVGLRELSYRNQFQLCNFKEKIILFFFINFLRYKESHLIHTHWNALAKCAHVIVYLRNVMRTSFHRNIRKLLYMYFLDKIHQISASHANIFTVKTVIDEQKAVTKHMVGVIYICTVKFSNHFLCM